jgi:hypothetical protein
LLKVPLYFFHFSFCQCSSLTARNWHQSLECASYLGDCRFEFRLGDGYPDWVFSWFSWVPPSECRECTLRNVYSKPFPK